LLTRQSILGVSLLALIIPAAAARAQQATSQSTREKILRFLDRRNGRDKSAAKRGADKPAAPRINVYDPKVDLTEIDPSVDPGVDPIFLTHPALNKSENYAYKFTQPGDHKLPADTCVISFDLEKKIPLAHYVARLKSVLSRSKGVAIYLVNGTELSDGDLKTVQTLNRPAGEGGLGFTSIRTLAIYNLKSLPGGVETQTPAMPGTPIRVFMWSNGWTDSRYAHVVLDDLEEVKDGTFCQTPFEQISLRGARTIGVMAFGGHRFSKPPLREIYLPSAVLIKTHAFRRCKNVVTVNLPKVREIGAYAFDDMTAMAYFNAPELRKMGRNALNDAHALTSVNFPRLEALGTACFDLNDKLRVMRLPALASYNGNPLSGNRGLQLLYVPSLNKLTRGIVNPSLRAVHAPKVTWIEDRLFADCPNLKKIRLPSMTSLSPGALAGMDARQIQVIFKGGRKRLLP